MPRVTTTSVRERFGRLVVVERVGTAKNGGAIFSCLCDCGVIKQVTAAALRRGNVVSCGCKKNDNARALGLASATHGASKSRTYNIWHGIKARVFNKNNPSYKDYGGRGVTMCKEWSESFAHFLKDMGPAPDGFVIDRIDCDGDYMPSNCRWVSTQQSAENKRCSRIVLLGGEKMTLEKAAKATGIPAATLRYRFKKRVDLGQGLAYV